MLACLMKQFIQLVQNFTTATNQNDNGLRNKMLGPRPLPEDIQKIEHPQHHGHIAGGQECGQVLHGVVQVPGEAVLNQQGSEVQDV